MNLSANFTLKELTKSDTATRLDLDNTPNDEQIESLKLLCENILQPVRDHFDKPVKISYARVKPAILRLMAYPIRSWQSGLKLILSTRN